MALSIVVAWVTFWKTSINYTIFLQTAVAFLREIKHSAHTTKKLPFFSAIFQQSYAPPFWEITAFCIL